VLDREESEAEDEQDPSEAQYAIPPEYEVVDKVPTKLDGSLQDMVILKKWEATKKNGTKGSEWCMGKISHVYKHGVLLRGVQVSTRLGGNCCVCDTIIAQGNYCVTWPEGRRDRLLKLEDYGGGDDKTTGRDELDAGYSHAVLCVFETAEAVFARGRVISVRALRLTILLALLQFLQVQLGWQPIACPSCRIMTTIAGHVKTITSLVSLRFSFYRASLVALPIFI